MHLIQSSTEYNRILEIFENGFKGSPGMTWMIGNNRSKLKSVLNVFIEEAKLKKGAFITSDGNGAVLYFEVQNHKKSFPLFCKRLYLFFFVLGINNGIKLLRYKKLIDSTRPDRGWLGWFVATDEHAEGTAAAFEIRREMFRIADEVGEPVFVETTIPRVRLLYRAAGYHQYAEVQHPFLDLTIWFMRRDPLPNQN